MKIMQAPSLYRWSGVHTPGGAAHPSAGFTAIELMVVVAIVAILTALAAPSFQPLIERWRVRDAAEGMTSTMYLARSEAIKRSGNVIIIKNPDNYLGSTCATTGLTDWSCGWRVFFDANGSGDQTLPCNAAAIPNECDIQTAPEMTRMTVNLAGSTGKIVVDRWGMASHGGGAPANMFFEVMPKGKDMTDASAARLCAGMGGRIVRKKGSETC